VKGKLTAGKGRAGRRVTTRANRLTRQEGLQQEFEGGKSGGLQKSLNPPTRLNRSQSTTMAQPTTLLTLPPELLYLITTHLPSSIDMISLLLSHPSLLHLYSPSLPVDIRSLRCRLHRDLLNPSTQTLYYCMLCPSPRIPCEKHGIAFVVGIAKRAAFRRVVNSSRDPPLRERWLRVATDLDRHKYCCITRG
jgi:hypothetical protein